MLIIFAIAILTLLAMEADASLVPMSWGFPTLVKNSSLTSFENMFALQTDNEFTDISFPTMSSDMSMAGFGYSTFPTISQVSSKSNMLYSVSFTNQQESMQFSYPWVSVGFSPVPSMGFL